MERADECGHSALGCMESSRRTCRHPLRWTACARRVRRRGYRLSVARVWRRLRCHSRPAVESSAGEVGLLHDRCACMQFTGLEEVLDAGLVDEHALPPYAELDDAAVIPLKQAVKLFAVFQYDGQVSLLLNLFLKIKRLGM